MPTFDFQCQKCSQIFEFARPFGSKTVPACPECKSKKTEKLMSTPAVVFKGSGWYKTDSRAGATSAPKKEEKKDAADKGAKGTEGTDGTKVETKKAEPKAAPKKSEKAA